jgi:hypothetical protein
MKKIWKRKGWVMLRSFAKTTGFEFSLWIVSVGAKVSQEE